MQASSGGGGAGKAMVLAPVGGGVAAAGKWSLSRKWPSEAREAILLEEQLHFSLSLSHGGWQLFSPFLSLFAYTLPPLLPLSNPWL